MGDKIFTQIWRGDEVDRLYLRNRSRLAQCDVRNKMEFAGHLPIVALGVSSKYVSTTPSSMELYVAERQ